MAKISRSDQPVWQQNAIFQFFASLKLAVVLLAVLIAGAIVGTLYESSFDAKVARAYVYGAPWFNAWLVLLGANLTVSALSRWPWKKYHSAFLITHLGIITLLIGAPAIHFKIETAMMNQHLESWLMADDPQHGNFSMGLANIELKRGSAPTSPSSITSTSKNEEKDLEESIFAFSKAPDEQIGHVNKGGSTGAKVQLEPPRNRNKGRVLISLGGKESSFDVAENVGREMKIEKTPFTLKIDNYWADFRIENGKPGSISDQPNNPAVLVTIRGKAVPTTIVETKNPHGGGELPTTGGPPTMPAVGDAAPNHLTLFVANDGAISYELLSRKSGKSSGKIDINKSLTTGWADWQLVIDKAMPHAEQWMDFTPAKSETTSTSAGAAELPDGVRIRVEQHGETLEQWVPAGWQVTVPTLPNETMVAYGWKTLPLPIGLELLDFEVKRNEGSDSPAGFKSTLRVSSSDGESGTGAGWMDHQFSYTSMWCRTWTGFTYKISQASWNPENLGQSSVQILRDPGWLLKWIGSLLVVIGVFMMFYLQPYRKQTEGEPITLTGPKPPKRAQELHPVAR